MPLFWAGIRKGCNNMGAVKNSIQENNDSNLPQLFNYENNGKVQN